jgi:signal transduction histidine kinase
MLRSKPFLTYFLICAVPLLLLAALNYWNGTRSVHATVESIVEEDLHSFTAGSNEVLDDRGSSLLRTAITPGLQRVTNDPSLRNSARAELKSEWDHGYFQRIVLFNRDRRPVWFATSKQQWELWDATVDNALRSQIPQPDERVWTTQGNVLLERPIESLGNSAVELAVPVHNESGVGNEGALVAIVDLKEVFSAAFRLVDSNSNRNDTSGAFLTVRNGAGNVIYRSEEDGAPQTSVATVSSPMPRFGVIAEVTRSTAGFASAARRWGIAGFVFALLFAFVAAFFLTLHVRSRSRGMARVEEDLSAIAHGDIDRRIELQSSDDARAIADNINAMTAQLRAQIAREEESRQFESFVRLSAMLTHDLKNAIEGLSLTVNNMERHFDNEQFRIDAMKGLTNATDKLKAIVARLSRPVSSLSGEHKRPTNIDLVPILKRVVAMTAEPARGKHAVQTKLPASLYALADPRSVEEVVENLILNALEAMGDNGGTLTLEAGPAANGEPSFSVSDTGPGMSQTFIDNRLFRPFSTTKKHGIGLGLYTCREVIRAGGGSIEVQSVEGAGTTFRVVLPSISNDRRN